MKSGLVIWTFFAVLALLALIVPAFLGWVVRLLFRLQHNYGLWVGGALALVVLLVALAGTTIGLKQFRVRRVAVVSESLPADFEGYRIVHFTDAHLGVFNGKTKYLHKAVDAILAQNADAIVFTGDLQTRAPSELEPYIPELSRLKARDGVFAVLGNHDYGYPPTTESPRGVREAEERAGWTVLVNSRTTLRRGASGIVLAGLDNDGDGLHFPRRGDLGTALDGVTEDDYVIVLEHDPSCWRRSLLPDGRADLTLSGHTHAMQFGLFGWSPSKWIYREYRGLYSENGRHLYVSSGLGCVIPFRFGMPGEIVVIELRSK